MSETRSAEEMVRVAIPVLVTFNSSSYTVREFSVDLSEEGIFLPTDQLSPVGTEGRLKFRANQFEEPFTVRGRVKRVVREGEVEGRPAGLEIAFLDLDDATRRSLRRVVEGVCDGSAVEAIRRSVLTAGRTLDVEIRQRPLDQKLMLAVHARHEEIQALIRDGHPTVLIRLMEGPRLSTSHVISVLRMPGLSTRVLTAIRRSRRWLASDQARWLFVNHPNTVLTDALAEMPMLALPRLQQMAKDRRLRPKLRLKAKELASQREMAGRS